MSVQNQSANAYLKWALFVGVLTGILVFINNSKEIQKQISELTKSSATPQVTSSKKKVTNLTKKSPSKATTATTVAKSDPINHLKKSGPKDLKRAKKFYQEAKRYQKRNPSRAYENFAKSCKLGYQYSCDFQAWFLEKGTGTTKNIAKAKELYQAGCINKSGYSCTRLGSMATVKKQFYTAYPFFVKGCKYKNKKACYSLASNYYNGQGVSKNRTTARKYFKKACKMGHQKACKWAKR